MARTPGPWTFDGRRWIRDAAGIGVLRVQIGANPEDVRAAAAAPEMAEVLAFCAAILGGLRNEGNVGKALCDAHDEARAILARIRGDAP